MQKIVALSKRAGFVYPSSEIYDGLNGFFDYGPMGTVLKDNIKREWVNSFAHLNAPGADGGRIDVQMLDSSVILNSKVWQASGHLDGFYDELTDCSETKKRYRADHVVCSRFSLVTEGAPDQEFWVSAVAGEGYLDDIAARIKFASKKLFETGRVVEQGGDTAEYSDLDADQQARVLAPHATKLGTLSAPRSFGLMFETSVGALSDSSTMAYLRPETAQGIFINFKNVMNTARAKVPFGIAQVGKSFRNEITPRNYIFRSREFEQMEMEWFCHPDEADKWFDYWIEKRMEWWINLGLSKDNLRLRPHEGDELAHYSNKCSDIEYKYPFSGGDFGELEGIANRGDFDLSNHHEQSNTKMTYRDAITGETYLPHVIEPAAGLTRGLLAVLCDAYRYDETRPSKEYFAFAPHIAPISAGIFPLTKKDGMPELATKLADHLQNFMETKVEVSASIGKRYARMDEIGTPYSVTVDADTLEKGTVTVRDRDTTQQTSVDISQVDQYLTQKINPKMKAMGQLSVK